VLRRSECGTYRCASAHDYPAVTRQVLWRPEPSYGRYQIRWLHPVLLIAAGSRVGGPDPVILIRVFCLGM
jgi:hypothetical protein